MHEGRTRVLVVKDDSKANQGWAKVFGTVFVIVRALAVVDHKLTSPRATIAAWFR
ncbi:hypothetical protein [Rhizobium tubonense]|uniref:hypothetical protein n=1 Tax=Rhizobium tubonense TaxID=484088 RepID=UPI0012B69B2A|nr:hypothetical protein [Rhizobium tubonense]